MLCGVQDICYGCQPPIDDDSGEGGVVFVGARAHSQPHRQRSSPGPQARGHRARRSAQRAPPGRSTWWIVSCPLVALPELLRKDASDNRARCRSCLRPEIQTTFNYQQPRQTVDWVTGSHSLSCLADAENTAGWGSGMATLERPPGGAGPQYGRRRGALHCGAPVAWATEPLLCYFGQEGQCSGPAISAMTPAIGEAIRGQPL